MADFVVNLITDYGYLGMFLGMVLEAVIIIIPSEVILATGGILASRGIFTFIGSFITGLLGSVFCAIVIYFMGYFGGKNFIKKYGKYFFMKEDELEKSDSWFNKYGMISALICRNLPIVRTLISLPIGITRQSFLKFVIYTTLGSIPWTLAFTYFGYKLGKNWIVINTYVNYLKTPIRVIIIIIIIRLIYKYYKKNLIFILLVLLVVQI